MRRILVVYGTTEGHTAKVAAAIGETLRTTGADVDVLDASRLAPSVRGYDGVIVAASLHGGHYQRSVARWVQENLAALHARPTAFVSVCLSTLEEPPRGPQNAAAAISGFLMLTGWKPTVSKTVAGALLYTQYNWLKRWVMKQIVAKAGGDTDTTRDYEYTDWIDLRAFTCQFNHLVATVSARSIAAA